MPKYRSYFLFICFFLWAGIIWARLFYWQVISSEKLARAETNQAMAVLAKTASRGEIFASDLRPLVLNERRYDLYLWRPNLVISLEELISKLKPFLKSEKEGEEQENESFPDFLENLAGKEQNWILLKKGMSQKEGQKIEDLGIKGLALEESWSRFYPEGSASAHLLGFLGKDYLGRNKGYFGLEGFYDRQLQGQSQLVLEKKGWWNKIQDIFLSKEGQKGRDLILFLDRAVQFILEEELKEGIERYGALSGWAIAMDPFSGGVLGMAAYPAYDPLFYYNFEEKLFPNPIIAQHFEPGSIFKPLIAASVLEEGKLEAEDQCPICDGPITIADYQIKTWNEQYYPKSSIKEIIEHSDNVGMVWLGQSLGKEKMITYLEKLNLGKKTGIDLEEEAALSLKEGRAWYPIDVATASFGQGIALTPIQMASAFCSLANGGYWVKPRLVKEIRQEGETMATSIETRAVFSSKTMELVKEMLINAVEKGEAKWTKLPDFQIAGKTGTAQIPISGHYDQEKTIASFIGFAPAQNPKFLMLVSLKEPKTSPWGSETAAPLWFNIAQRLLNYWSLFP